MKYIKDFNRPRLLKTDFKVKTLEKFKSMKGLGFGTYRYGEEFNFFSGNIRFVRNGGRLT